MSARGPESADYFSNHRLKLRFPWSLYHRPIVRALDGALAEGGPDVLNIGSGPFFELSELSHTAKRFTLCDIDERAVALARELHGAAVRAADVISPDASLPYADASFDVVVSMDVVEHVPEPLPWVRGALRVLKPGGRLFLTTPNYSSRSLKLIEGTVLEAFARAQGFSRRDLHPTKLDPGKLRELCRAAGARDVCVDEIAFGWVLAASATR